MIGDRGVRALLVPGFGDGSLSWRGLVEAGGRPWGSVELVDLPGVGVSEPPPVASVAAMSDHIGEQINRGARPVVLIGHSLGSAIAVEAAAALPSDVAGVLSIEGNLTSADGYFSAVAAEHHDATSFVEWLTERVRELIAQDDAPSSYLMSILGADPTTLWSLGKDSARCGEGDAFGHAYRALQQPTRYLWSRRSTPATTQDFLRVHGLDNRAIENAGHWPLEREPAWVIDQIDDFVDAALRQAGVHRSSRRRG